MPWTLKIYCYRDFNRSSLEDQSTKTGYNLSVQLSQKFCDDKAYIETTQYNVVLDGIVLNSIEMIKAYKSKTMSDTLIAAYQENGESFIKELRGSFNGALYDKAKDLWILFVNQYGDRPLFYYESESCFYISTDFNEVANYVQQNGDKYEPNMNASYYLLTYGFMIDNSTHIKGIYRLMPGDYIRVHRGKLEIVPYFRFGNSKIDDISFDEAVDLIDYKFRKAVTRIFNKDLQYGYFSHLADMSGGLDSRMVSWVARQIGYENITNICYAQSHSIEWRAAIGVANALGNDIIYMPLDKCNFIYDIDETVSNNYGLAFYAGITGGKRLLNLLNPNLFGLEITGQLGDVVIGSFIHGEPRHSQPRFRDNMYSNRLQFEFDEKLLDEFENQEMFSIYKRGFLGALSTHIIRNNVTDVVSPFCDVDFLSFCLSLPLDYRVNHRLYNAWICRKYPDAARLYAVNYEGSIKENMKWRMLRKRIKYGLINRGKRYLSLSGIKIKENPANMNPMQYWYKNDNKVRKFIHEYYEENIKRLSNSMIFKDIEDLFYNGNMIDKLLVLTVLASYKKYNLTY